MGSSPHTRGALRTGAAGPSHPRDHPRIRGEHESQAHALGMRPGIIPAYAGSTVIVHLVASQPEGSSPHTRGAPRSTTSAGSRWRDHPRIRGEHNWDNVVTKLLPGIIPAYAGSTGHVVDCAFRRLGIIPAYAGSTFCPSRKGELCQGSSPHTRGARLSSLSSMLASRDHPRIRGEHLGLAVLHNLDFGIIPAYAGSTGWLK